MKRYGHVIDKIVSHSNLSESYDYVMRGKKRKTSRSGRYIIRHKEEIIESIRARISDGSFSISQFKQYTINERGKERLIQSIPLSDRIALNAIMRIVEEYLNKTFIANTAASIKGRGGHYLLHRMLSDIQRIGTENVWVYKCDIRHFYQSIDQDKMMDVLRRYFKDEKLLKILDGCVRLLPEGLSIGLRTSQALGNLYLSHYVDHVIKDKMGVKYYYRYCDDIVVLSDSAESLTPVISAIKSCVKDASLTIKPNEQVYCLKDRCIDFLGFMTYSPKHIRTRKHIKQRFARRWKRVWSRKRKSVLAASFYGMAKHAGCRNLFKTITHYSMKDFASFGFQYVAAYGKKRFDCESYPLGDLQNRTIEVYDYEKNVKTKEGEGRYVVRFKERELGEGKFFTASEELKQMLDKVREVDGFPFRTTIRRQMIGKGKVKYSFT